MLQMIVNGITLLQMIKEGKIKENTKIVMLFDGATTSTILKYKLGQLIWNPGEFMVCKLWDDDFDFKIIEEVEKPKKINDFKLRQEKGETLIVANMWSIMYKLNEQSKAINYLLEKEK